MNQATLESTWNGTFTSSSSDSSQYTVIPDDWMQAIAPNQTRNVGFCANKTGSDYQPQNLVAEQL